MRIRRGKAHARVDEPFHHRRRRRCRWRSDRCRTFFSLLLSLFLGPRLDLHLWSACLLSFSSAGPAPDRNARSLRRKRKGRKGESSKKPDLRRERRPRQRQKKKKKGSGRALSRPLVFDLSVFLSPSFNPDPDLDPFYPSIPHDTKLTLTASPSSTQPKQIAPRPALASRRSTLARAAPKGDPNQKMMWEALREAVDEEMERDPTVCLMGEDVGHYGGSYKVTYDLYKKYGDLRLLDTPICENGFMGVGIGAAMTGLRVIIEGMNMGFLLLAYNQISNNAGMLHYTSGGQFKVPVVIRGPGGVGRQLGAEHSQRLESYFQSIPGVQLVACSTAANAKALLKSAIRSDNPVSSFVVVGGGRGELERVFFLSEKNPKTKTFRSFFFFFFHFFPFPPLNSNSNS